MTKKGISLLKIMLLASLILIVASSSIAVPLGLNKVTYEEAISNVASVEFSSWSNAQAPSWDFNRVNEWAEFAEVTQDTVDVVVGINNAKANSFSAVAGLVLENFGKIADMLSINGEHVAVVAKIPQSKVANFNRQLQQTGLVRYVEPNLKFQASFTPNDPNWTIQWGPKKIQADYAWDTTMGSSAILVAVIDTGIYYNHPDLKANYVAKGRDWVNNDNDPADDEGHGTHCAGIIGAVTNNGIGIAGIAQVQIMAEKGLNSEGSGESIDLANAIVHAVDQGAKILSLSWGSYFYSNVIHDAIKYAYAHDVLVVAAAGNDGTTLRHYPASYPEVISVSATTSADLRASWSNYGNWIELGAPGENIFSTYTAPNYRYLSGTSMACPHVVGVAALAWSLFPDYSRDWIRKWLRYTSDDLGTPGFDNDFGYGRVNARKAVEDTPSAHDVFIASLDKPTYIDAGNTAVVNATVVNFGTSDETDVTIQLLVNGTVENSTVVSLLEKGKSATVSLSWTSSIESICNITAYAVPVSGETSVEDNYLSGPMLVGIRTIVVPDHMPTIQEAIDVAVEGLTVYVRNGTYNENLYVNKPLTLAGESKESVIVRGTDALRGAVVYVLTNNVNITGFTFRRSGAQQPYYAGVLLDWVSNVSVYGNIFTENMAGVFLWECSNCYIFNNNFTKNYDYAVAIHNSTFCTVSENLLIDNKAGFWFNYSRDCYAVNNFGKDNDAGFELVGSTDCLVTGNEFTNNLYGANITLSTGNKIFHNSFVSNTIAQVITNSVNEWDNGYPDGGNFWSNHVTTDLYSGPYQNETGSDGIVDTQYVINSNNKDKYPIAKKFAEFTHDIALLSATPQQLQIDGGQILNFSVEVENLGDKAETFNINIYGNNSLLESKAVPCLLVGENKIVTVGWNTVGFTPAVYSIEVEATPVAGETELENNVYADGEVEIIPAHDVAPTLIVPSKTIIGQGYSMTFNVTVLNKGTFDETFNVFLYADLDINTIGDEITIGMATTPVLASAETAVLSFTWNTASVPKGHYIISAYAVPVSGETSTADNMFTDGEVYVAVPGDVDGNRIVNMLDLYKIALVFGANEGQPNYVPACDVDCNGKINMLDLYIAALNFGQSGP
ncbi:MAG: S8 family serine peptidase [Candidatus Bathyarchaeia archaeon]